LAKELEALPGVAAVDVVHQTRRGVIVIGADGQPTASGFGPPFIAAGYPSDSKMNPFTLKGSPPTTETEVVLDRKTAELAGAKIGDAVTIRTPSAIGQFTLTGTVTLGQNEADNGRALFSPAVAVGFNSVPGTASRLQVRAAPGVSQDALKAEIDPVLQKVNTSSATAAAVPIEAITGTAYVAELQARVADLLTILNNALLGFALLSLFVGAFIVYNTFSILVTQRQREIALLRAVGASRRQVVGSVMGEALAIGAFAGALGVAGGAGLAKGLTWGFRRFGFALPTGDLVVRPAVIAIAAATGIAMALACAWFPALRASKIAPVAALRDLSIDRSNHSVLRLGVGLVFMAASIALLITGVRGSGSQAAIMVGIATAATFVGVTVLGPRLVTPFVALFGFAFRPFGITGRLATQNAKRNPRRTASTGSALMIGVAIVSFVLVMSATLKGMITETTQRSITADLIVTADPDGRTALTVDAIADVRAVRGVERVGAVFLIRALSVKASAAPTSTPTSTPAGRPGASAPGDSQRPQRIAAVSDIAFAQSPVTVESGRASQLGVDGTIISTEAATERKLKLGDALVVTFADGTTAPVQVVGIASDLSAVGTDFIVSDAFAAKYQPTLGPSQLLVDRSAGESNTSLIRKLRAVPALLGTSVQDISSYAETQASSLDTIVGIFMVMLALSIVIALFGIANTLALSIHERTREIGLLRAIGTTRSQIGSMIRMESIVLALIGTAEGAVIGVVFGGAIATTLLNDPSVPTGLSVTYPWGQLVGVMAVAVVAGVAASVGATRRAKRLEVLGAIAAE
jgi:putative ABC transport system permease protein